MWINVDKSQTDMVSERNWQKWANTVLFHYCKILEDANKSMVTERKLAIVRECGGGVGWAGESNSKGHEKTFGVW